MTIAAEAKRVVFGYLKSTLDLAAGHLSHHNTVLEAGLLDVGKGYDGKRPKTWVSVTNESRVALAAEMPALRARLDRHSRGR